MTITGSPARQAPQVYYYTLQSTDSAADMNTWATSLGYSGEDQFADLSDGVHYYLPDEAFDILLTVGNVQVMTANGGWIDEVVPADFSKFYEV